MNTLTKKEIDNLSPSQLKDLAKRGILQVVNNMDTSLPIVSKEQSPEYLKHAHLRGRKIAVTKAADKYRIPNGTISRWASAGYITVLGKEGRKTLLDEADVAYCAEIHRQRGSQGKWLFNKDGTKYVPTTRPA